MSAHQLMETKLHVIPHTSSGRKADKLLDLSRSRTHFLYSIPSLFSSFSNYFQPIPPSLLRKSEPSDLSFLTFTSTIAVLKGISSFSHDHSVMTSPYQPSLCCFQTSPTLQRSCRFSHLMKSLLLLSNDSRFLFVSLCCSLLDT